MKRKADEGIGRKQGGLSIRLSEGNVKGGNKMQTKTKVKLTPLLVSSPLSSPTTSPPLSFPPPPPPSLSSTSEDLMLRHKAIFLSLGLATKEQFLFLCIFCGFFNRETENITWFFLVFGCTLVSNYCSHALLRCYSYAHARVTNETKLKITQKVRERLSCDLNKRKGKNCGNKLCLVSPPTRTRNSHKRFQCLM